jgi:hypothetical protein
MEPPVAQICEGWWVGGANEENITKHVLLLPGLSEPALGLELGLGLD